jgi:hypothetical protein
VNRPRSLPVSAWLRVSGEDLLGDTHCYSGIDEDGRVFNNARGRATRRHCRIDSVGGRCRTERLYLRCDSYIDRTSPHFAQYICRKTNNLPATARRGSETLRVKQFRLRVLLNTIRMLSGPCIAGC